MQKQREGGALKTIYLVRHCAAKGQEPEAELTEAGYAQALELAAFLADKPIDRILSSSYKRAVQTILPLAGRLHMDVEQDERLTERILSAEHLPDWFEKLQETFMDVDLTLPGGESSRQAMKRIASVVEEIWAGEAMHTVLVTHGNIMSLLLKYYDDKVGFAEWRSLSNPDVFVLRMADEVTYERIWK
jgi:2,3-bisphosphoglycerate-dependent phosphoglycerate mutase